MRSRDHTLASVVNVNREGHCGLLCPHPGFARVPVPPDAAQDVLLCVRRDEAQVGGDLGAITVSALRTGWRSLRRVAPPEHPVQPTFDLERRGPELSRHVIGTLAQAGGALAGAIVDGSVRTWLTDTDGG